MATFHVRYFAVLREQAGIAEERLETLATTPAELFRELARRHRWMLDERVVRASVNERFVDMGSALRDGDRVAFIPPVSGG
ncbi:MAG: molybdopterin converting factor subunit 1 [Verrucomicrobia bacterium]|nr:molybdopterin converting factor subunit 1 [Verrucomicrobiota bacterium]